MIICTMDELDREKGSKNRKGRVRNQIPCSRPVYATKYVVMFFLSLRLNRAKVLTCHSHDKYAKLLQSRLPQY